MNYRASESMEVGAIPPVEPPNWWICFTQWNGLPGRAGPYILPQAQLNMRCTHWRPDAKPKLKRMFDGGKKSWGDQIADRKRMAKKERERKR